MVIRNCRVKNIDFGRSLEIIKNIDFEWALKIVTLNIDFGWAFETVKTSLRSKKYRLWTGTSTHYFFQSLYIKPYYTIRRLGIIKQLHRHTIVL